VENVQSIEDRSPETREIVLKVCAEKILKGNESDIRIADLCSATGLSSSVIYNNFQSRLGLIDATYLMLYEQFSNARIETFRELCKDVSSAEEFLVKVMNLNFDDSTTEVQELYRGLKIRIAAACLTRKALRKKIGAIERHVIDELAVLMDGLIERGVLGRFLNGRQIAVILGSVSFGEVFEDEFDVEDGLEFWTGIMQALIKILTLDAA
jgi:AcrR family transcriptional regulator